MWFGRQGRSNVRMRVDVGISLPSTFLCTRWIWTTPSGSKKDLISVSLSETKSSWVTTPLHKFNVGWGSTLTWRPAKDLTEEIASICRSVLASRRTLPSRCRVTFFKLPQTPSILRANFRPLTLFIVLPSSIHESSRKRCFVGWVAAKKTRKSDSFFFYASPLSGYGRGHGFLFCWVVVLGLSTRIRESPAPWCIRGLGWTVENILVLRDRAVNPPNPQPGGPERHQ